MWPEIKRSGEGEGWWRKEGWSGEWGVGSGELGCMPLWVFFFFFRKETRLGGWDGHGWILVRGGTCKI